MEEALLKVVAAPSFFNRLACFGPCRQRMPDWLLLSTYVPPQE